MTSILNWKIAGLAGEGIATTGLLFAKLALRHGLNVFAYGEYPSLIRGGHNTLQVAVSSEPVTAQQRHIDVLLALNDDAIKLHLAEFDSNTIILADKTNAQIKWENYNLTATIIDIPFKAISLATTQGSIAENMVALGASSALFGFKLEILQNLIAEIFNRKGDVIVQKNQAAAATGYASIANQPSNSAKFTLATFNFNQPPQILVSGSEAIGLGALSAGIQFYAAYPMSPASTLLHFMAEHEKNFPLIVKHAEDEISAINQAIGASFAGARAMTASAGGGFALMVEACSLAGVAETPLVVMEAQRPGPATGLPTWTGQADLQFILHAGHGEFPKVVIAPGDVQECFDYTRLAFELAEKYQTQVYILADKLILEAAVNAPSFQNLFTNQRYSMVTENLPADNSYQRFVDTPEGYSPRSIPGQAHGLQLTNSYEHDEHGYATEDAAMTVKMVNKRQRKLAGLLVETPPPQLIGPTQAEITFVSWGSTKMVLENVLQQLNTPENPNIANAIHLTTLMPFPTEIFLKLAKTAQNLVMVEANFNGQGQALIREKTGLDIPESIRRYDGRPFYAEDILAWVKNRRTK